MAHRCLADVLEELGHAGELARIDAEVDSHLEIAELSRRVAKAGGPALLFGSVAGHGMPVLTNLLATEERIERVLGGRRPTEVGERIAAMLSHSESAGGLPRLKTVLPMRDMAALQPRRIRTGPCQQVVRLGRDVDLGQLPLLKLAPEESALSITAATIFTSHPESRRQVGARHDLQRLGPDRLAMLWAPHDEIARLMAAYQRRRQTMPLAIVLGGDPAVLLAAAAPAGPDTDTLALAGLLREKPIDVVPCRNSELLVPAEADIVVEGYLDPSEPLTMTARYCGPLGLYQPPCAAPVMHVTAMTQRANPIFPAIVLAAPPHEGTRIYRALTQILLPAVRLSIPELVDYDLPLFGAARHFGAISIQKTYAGQSRHVASAAWSLRPFQFAKLLVVVDEDVDVHSPEAVLGALATNANPGRDVFFLQGPPDRFDPATPPGALGHKMAIDGTAKLPDEHAADWPSPAAMPEAIRHRVIDRWLEYGLGPMPREE